MCGKVIRSDDDGVLAKFTEQARGQIEKLNKKPSLVECTLTSIHNVWKPLTEKTIMDRESASIKKEFKSTKKHRRNLQMQKRVSN